MPALGRIFVTPADLGRKVSLRHLVAGAPTDALGTLVDWHHGICFVETKNKVIKEVPFENLIAAKVVPPEVSAAWVQSQALKVWRANETQNLGDWVLQSSGNEAARVNSCLLVGSPKTSAEDSLKEVITWYQSRGLTPLAHLSAPGVFDSILEKMGFEKTRLIDFLYKEVTPQKVETNIKIDSALTKEWLAAVNQNNGASRSVERFTLESGDWVRFLSLESQGEIIATARISGVEVFALVTNLFVNESHRGQGIAQALMKSVEQIAFEFNMKHIWLQVLHTNEVAQKLYQKLKFHQHHQYQYWAYSQSRV